MAESLKSDVFIFSGLKTHAQLLEASRMLLDDDGKVKSFASFSRDVEKLKSGYNQTYLEAEYIFATTSAQMAGKWAELDSNYDLQYRTANDSRVRDSHRLLHDITLPVDDAFWLSYYPPNGWRCRCNAVQVRKGKYQTSDSAKAVRAGEMATMEVGKDGKNKLAIFRFNPGAQKVVFPPAHPYNNVAGADKVKRALKPAQEDEKRVLDYFEKPEAEIRKMPWYKAAQQISKAVRPTEALAVREYTGSFYNAINRYLRRGREPKNEMLNAYERVLNIAMSKLKSYSGPVFRGTDLTEEQFGKYLAAMERKEPFIEAAFFSTTSSMGQKFKGNTMYVVRSKNGKIVREISEFPTEDEILFKSGTSFKVVRAAEIEGKYEIELEED